MFFYLIGLIVVGYVFYCVAEEIYKCFQPFPNIKQKYTKDGWAVVTGATDGIGKGFCEILSQQGVNICMIVRNEQKALAMIKELGQRSQSKFKIVIADFAKSDQEGFFEKIMSQIDSLDIGFLVNNVGVSQTGPFTDLSDEVVREHIVVNCFPIVFLTRYIVPIMQKRQQKSAIINLSSMAGRIPIGYKQVYCATKAFDDFFSRALSQELENIDVLSLRPLYVTTPLTKQRTSHGSITANECARGGLQRLGLEHATHGHFKHRIQGLFVMLVPESVRRIGQLRVLKQRGLQKN